MSNILATNKISNPPLRSKAASSYLWADYIELRCLFHPDRELSIADVLNIVWNQQDLGEVDEFDSSDKVEADLLPDEFDSSDRKYDFYLQEPSDDVPLEDTPSEITDRNERQAGIWFEYLEYRQRAFGKFYPYELDGHSLRCKENFEFDPKMKLYLFLLLCSSLKYIEKQYEDEFTSRFEIISLIALKNLLPKQGKVSLVGKNKLNSGKYAGKIWRKITKLSEDIGESISPQCSEKGFALNDSGDRGLDILGKVSLGDRLPSSLILFGQCGCGKKWEDKQLEAHYINWNRFIHFTVPPNNLVFIPYCFRSADGGWFNHLDVTAGILVDRLRLVHLLQNKLDVLARLHPYDKFVESILEYTEPLVGG